MSKHFKTVFDNEQELLKVLIDLHMGGQDIELDPMYNKGHFYTNGVNDPKLKYDLTPSSLFVKQGDATNLPLEDSSIERMILDPPFLFGLHGQAKNFGSSKRYTIFPTFKELEDCYLGILKESKRLLKPKGILIFKCQDYTDSRTTMTHALVYNWATELGFYAKDLAILVKPNKVYNGNTTQRHLRKIHTYFWVFERKKSL